MTSYSSIAHLVQSIHVEQHVVHLSFLSDCGGYSQTVTVPRELSHPPETARSSRKTMMAWVTTALKRVLSEDLCCNSLTQAEVESLTLKGFEQISPHLTRIDGRWVGALRGEHPSEFFERQLRGSPIQEPYDLEVLVRVLLEVSRSDSDWRLEEKLFLEEVVKDRALVGRLTKAPKITVAELAEVSSLQVKQTILMLAWAMAYADGSLDPEEMVHLTHLCRGFMLPEQRVRELQLAAKLSLLDRYLESQRGLVSALELKERFNRKAQDWGVCEHNLCKLRAWYPEDFPADSQTSALLSAEDDV